MANKDIIQELSDLGSSLPGPNPGHLYAVPEGYFEGFATKLLELANANEWLTSLPKETRYLTPEGYFAGLEEKIMQHIRNHPDYKTSKEELETISPLLNSLSKRPVYTVPGEYFENFALDNPANPTTKVISMPGRSWMRYAAAAVVTGIIALAGFMIYNNNHKDAAGRTMAKFEKEVKKIDDVKSTETLIDLMDGGMNDKELATNHKTVRTDDVQQLLKDVSNDELKDFTEQSKDIEDVMMTN